MLKKTVTYTDYDGNQRTEDFYFNISKAELIKLNSTTVGGFENLIHQITNSPNPEKLFEIFAYIVELAYGEKSPDGRRLIKTQEAKDNFTQTQAYSDIFTELATDEEAALAFIKAILPPDISGEINK